MKPCKETGKNSHGRPVRSYITEVADLLRRKGVEKPGVRNNIDRVNYKKSD